MSSRAEDWERGVDWERTRELALAKMEKEIEDRHRDPEMQALMSDVLNPLAGTPPRSFAIHYYPETEDAEEDRNPSILCAPPELIRDTVRQLIANYEDAEDKKESVVDLVCDPSVPPPQRSRTCLLTAMCALWGNQRLDGEGRLGEGCIREDGEAHLRERLAELGKEHLFEWVVAWAERCAGSLLLSEVARLSVDHAFTTLQTRATTQRRLGRKVGRNDPCVCGSGKKFKRCCG